MLVYWSVDRFSFDDCACLLFATPKLHHQKRLIKPSSLSLEWPLKNDFDFFPRKGYSSQARCSWFRFMIEKLWRFRKAHKLFIFHPLFPPSQTSTASKRWVIFKHKNTTSNFSSINHLECEALLHLPLFLDWGLDPIYSNIQPINKEHPTPPKTGDPHQLLVFFLLAWPHRAKSRWRWRGFATEKTTGEVHDKLNGTLPKQTPKLRFGGPGSCWRNCWTNGKVVMPMERVCTSTWC